MTRLRLMLLLLAFGLGLASPALAKRTKRKKRAPKPAAAATVTPPAAAPPAASKAGGTPAPGLRRSNRMEFDARVVKGERATGAVYLFQRVPRRLPPLLRLRPNPLDRIVRPVLRRGVDRRAETPSE
jgi:hypothetical protein